MTHFTVAAISAASCFGWWSLSLRRTPYAVFWLPCRPASQQQEEV